MPSKRDAALFLDKIMFALKRAVEEGNANGDTDLGGGQQEVGKVNGPIKVNQPNLIDHNDLVAYEGVCC